MAERVGFEPTVRVHRTLDFESSPFDHSGTSPRAADCTQFGGQKARYSAEIHCYSGAARVSFFVCAC